MSSPDPAYVRSLELLSRKSSRLLVVDVQEKLIPAIHHGDDLVQNCCRLVRGAKILEVPVAATEQYPRGLGATAAPLAALLEKPPEKLRFSCAEVLQWGLENSPASSTSDRFQVVVCGIEAHVCVLQTVLDLISQGLQVFVPADAVASRREFDWKIALDRMASSGAIICTLESVLFEWCEVAGTPEFKQISQLVKERDAGLAAKS
ncbi:MAG: isochorismatase family protein [Planctomycetales bacterium]|nr:isochorismatase family protein [Planctomycetales bacterium]